MLISHERLDGLLNQLTAYGAHGLLVSALCNKLVSAPLAHAHVQTRHQHHALCLLHANDAHVVTGVLLRRGGACRGLVELRLPRLPAPPKSIVRRHAQDIRLLGVLKYNFSSHTCAVVLKFAF